MRETEAYVPVEGVTGPSSQAERSDESDTYATDTHHLRPYGKAAFKVDYSAFKWHIPRNSANYRQMT